MKLSISPRGICENWWELHHSPVILIRVTWWSRVPWNHRHWTRWDTSDPRCVRDAREEAWVGRLDILISQATRTGNALVLDLSSSSQATSASLEGSVYDTNPNFMHYLLGKSRKLYHAFARFDSLIPPKLWWHVMTPALCERNFWGWISEVSHLPGTLETILALTVWETSHSNPKKTLFQIFKKIPNPKSFLTKKCLRNIEWDLQQKPDAAGSSGITTSSEKNPWTKTKSSTHVSKKIGSKEQKWTWFYSQHGYMEKSYFTKNSREIGLHNFIEIWIFQTHKSKLPFGCGLKRHWLPRKNDGWKLELQMFTIDQSRKKPILVISFSDLPRADVCWLVHRPGASDKRVA